MRRGVSGGAVQRPRQRAAERPAGGGPTGRGIMGRGAQLRGGSSAFGRSSFSSAPSFVLAYQRRRCAVSCAREPCSSSGWASLPSARARPAASRWSATSLSSRPSSMGWWRGARGVRVPSAPPAPPRRRSSSRHTAPPLAGRPVGPVRRSRAAEDLPLRGEASSSGRAASQPGAARHRHASTKMRYLILLALAKAQCPDRCNQKGLCGKDGLCECFTGYTGLACQHRSCVSSTAWSDVPSATDQAHAPLECSNRGYCNRATGYCICEPLF